MTDYNDGKWHGWNGGDCPVHGRTVVEVVFANANGTVMRAEKRMAEEHIWGKNGPLGATIAFRVVKEYREPREFWLVCDCVFDKEKDAQAEASMHPAVADIIHVREVLE